MNFIVIYGYLLGKMAQSLFIMHSSNVTLPCSPLYMAKLKPCIIVIRALLFLRAMLSIDIMKEIFNFPSIV